MNRGTAGILHDVYDEISAYKRQGAYLGDNTMMNLSVPTIQNAYKGLPGIQLTTASKVGKIYKAHGYNTSTFNQTLYNTIYTDLQKGPSIYSDKIEVYK